MPAGSLSRTRGLEHPGPRCGRVSNVIDHPIIVQPLPQLRESLEARAYPMPGQLIDVGGHRLHLYCTGSGSPTVVLEPGHGGSSSDFGWIAPTVARDTRVCVYDRAGRGWSDATDGPQDGAHVAADLRTLLERAP